MSNLVRYPVSSHSPALRQRVSLPIGGLTPVADAAVTPHDWQAQHPRLSQRLGLPLVGDSEIDADQLIDPQESYASQWMPQVDYPRPRNRIAFGESTIDPTPTDAIADVFPDNWYVQQLVTRRQLVPVHGDAVSPLEPSLIITPITDWITQQSEAPRAIKPRPPSYWDGVLDPTLFVAVGVPSMDSWFRPQEFLFPSIQPTTETQQVEGRGDSIDWIIQSPRLPQQRRSIADFQSIAFETVSERITGWIRQSEITLPISRPSFDTNHNSTLNPDLFVVTVVPDFGYVFQSTPIFRRNTLSLALLRSLTLVEVVTTIPTPTTPATSSGVLSRQRPTIREGGTHRVRVDFTTVLDESDTIIEVSVAEAETSDLEFTAVDPLQSRKLISGFPVDAGKGIEFFVSGHLASTGIYKLKITYRTRGELSDISAIEDFVFDVIE